MTENTNETQIRALVQKWAKAVRAKDMEGALAHHASDIVMFDVPVPHAGPGDRGVQENLGAVLRSQRRAGQGRSR